jgi:hypothetical protein
VLGQRSSQPTPAPELWSWTVLIPGAATRGLGAVGVSDDRQQVVTNLTQALREAPAGAQGLVHQVTVAWAFTPVYHYEGLFARAEVDDGTGTVIWQAAQHDAKRLDAQFPRRVPK